jgi:4-amino-4-deoxy-L-arabinose transferase-like glycosyltransferase
MGSTRGSFTATSPATRVAFLNRSLAERRQNRSPVMDNGHFNSWSRLSLLVAIVASVGMIYIYPLALPTPLLDPDEGLHASIAQEMVERGDYLVPRFCGEPFRDKPILYFAAQAASLRLFGMNETAVRLPGFAFALLGCWTTALLARRLFDAEAAVYAALASLTLVLPVVLTQSPAHDIALVPWINLLVLCFWEQEQAASTASRWKWVAGATTCVALALLTKGLIGVAVISVGIGLYAIVTRSLSWGLVARGTLALVAGGILASPWFLTMEAASPGYLYYYFVQRHFLGYISEGQHHGLMPWHFYFAPVFGGAMPWLAYATASVLQVIPDGQVGRDDGRSRQSRAIVLLACWFVGGLLFLTVANSKLLTYTLPLFPPLAVLAGLGFRRLFHDDLAPAIRLMFVTTFRLCCVFGVFATVGVLLTIDHVWHEPSPAAAYAVAVLASAFLAAAFVLFERKQLRAALAVGMLWFPIGFVALATWPMQRLASLHSQRSLQRAITRGDTLPQNVVLIGERIGSFMFYLSPKERAWFREGRMRSAWCDELETLIPPKPGTVIVVADKELRQSKVVDRFLRLKPLAVGEFHLVESIAEPVEITKLPGIHAK